MRREEARAPRRSIKMQTRRRLRKFLLFLSKMQIVWDRKTPQKSYTHTHTDTQKRNKRRLIMFCLVYVRREERARDTCEQSARQQQGELIREDISGSLAEGEKKTTKKKRKESRTQTQSCCSRTSAAAAAAPVNNLIPESAVLNKVSLGLAF